jgi:hypothetical protein
VFVAGGGSGGASNTVQVYDIATNTWSAGTVAPNTFLLAGYQQVGQYLYVIGGFGAVPNGPANAAEMSSVLHRGAQRRPNVPEANNTTSLRLDMSSAPGVWTTGPAFTQGRADFGLAYDAGTNTLYALGGDATGGGFFDSTNLVDELSVAAWPAGTWTASPPNLPLPNRQANQAGFYGAGDIWSVGGINGATVQFLADVYHRTNGQVCTPTPTATTTPTATATATSTPTPTPRPQPTPPPFFSGELSLDNGVYYLQFPNGTPFGYYAYLTDQHFIYHFDMGYEYWFDANDGQGGIFFYDFASGHFFYTSPSFPFPYIYDFNLHTVLYYYPDPGRPGHYTTNPRYFYNFATGQIITM